MAAIFKIFKLNRSSTYSRTIIFALKCERQNKWRESKLLKTEESSVASRFAFKWWNSSCIQLAQPPKIGKTNTSIRCFISMEAGIKGQRSCQHDQKVSLNLKPNWKWQQQAKAIIYALISQFWFSSLILLKITKEPQSTFVYVTYI